MTAPADPTGDEEIHFTEIVLPEHANHYGTLYGPNALRIMGKAAFVCASRYARCAVVMAKADDVEFRRPVRLGSIVDIRARVASRGRSSMTVLVDLVPGAAAADRPAISGRFTMVAVDDGGVPIAIPFFEQTRPEEVVS
ncbi:acyl-CoA thioesterase [Labrys sp. WJW]|uniref:acyl-CoA thioesterase n=1 Tax=Labrys sp. WJW TaxID=1737983 RepID=UPI0008341C26|nr:acyl-CoA thioesterase [Labrys sp. WJW]OCC05545.1 acyl-CoA thioesterase [Labrys sp. WJW]